MCNNQVSGFNQSKKATTMKTPSSVQEVPLTSKGFSRRKIWDLWPSAPYSILGTCLTSKSLRSLAKKLAASTPGVLPDEYEIHSFFSCAARSKSPASRLLNKLLDQTHALWIKKTTNAETRQNLRTLWEDAVHTGDLAGAYWAILTHPNTDEPLYHRLFADVQIMSYQALAMQQSDTNRFSYYEKQIADLKEALATKTRRHEARLAVKQEQITNLTLQISTLNCLHHRNSDAHSSEAAIVDLRPELLTKARLDLADAQSRLVDAENRANACEAELSTLKSHYDHQVFENSLLEKALNVRLSPQHDRSGPEPRLQGKAILYVGGRSKAAPRLRAAIESEGGAFDFHDGGLEQSQKLLIAAICKADLVAFPTDCVSHEAVALIKKTCGQNGTPFAPLRSAGTASLLAGLQQWLARETMLAAAE